MIAIKLDDYNGVAGNYWRIGEVEVDDVEGEEVETFTEIITFAAPADVTTESAALTKATEILAELAAPPVPSLVDYQNAVQAHVDAAAKARSYTDGVSLAGYLNSTVPAWAAEAAAFIAWRDAVWVYAYGELEKVQNAERSQPTVDDFIDELPSIAWPSPAP